MHQPIEEKDYGLLRPARFRFYFMADRHNAYQKFLLPPCKGMEQTIRYQPEGSTENETSLDKRYRTATQDILRNLHHQVVY